MSISKSFCALAALSLVASGQLSLDQKMSSFVPEWRNDARGTITLRDVLAMTTGLADPFASYFSPNVDTETILRQSRLVALPGRSWAYNNNAINLLDVAVRGATGHDVDEVLRERLFGPLGITSYKWSRDIVGNAVCTASLTIKPTDLAKVGELLLDDGVYHGRPILPPDIYSLLAHPSQPYESDYGFGWWVLRHGSIPGEKRVATGSIIAIEALAAKGQALYLSLSEQLIVVRLIDIRRWRSRDDSFFDFEPAVQALTEP